MDQMDFYPEMPKRTRSKQKTPGKTLETVSFKEALRLLFQRLPMACCFFLLSLAQCFSVPSPFAVCALLALTSMEADAGGAVLGVAAGIGFQALWGRPLDWGQGLACLCCFPLVKLTNKTEGQTLLLALALLIARSLPILAAAQDGQAIVLCGAGMALGLATVPAFRRVAAILKDKAWRAAQDDLLCLALPFLLLLCGASRLSLFQINLGYLLSVACALSFSWLCGAAYGVCLGLGCGLALLIGGESALLLVNLSFGALMAGIFQGRLRPMTATVYCLCSLSVTYLIASAFYPALFAAEAAAGLGFCLIPKRWTQKIGGRIRQLRWNHPRDHAYLRMKTQDWICALQRISDALPEPRIFPASLDAECDSLATQLCEGCERLPICWHEKEAQTRQGMAALLEQGTGTDDYLTAINAYFSLCPRISRLPDLLIRVNEERRKRVQMRICAEYEREMLQTHLTALSQSARNIFFDGTNPDEQEGQWFLETEEALQALRYPGQTAFVKRIDGRMMVCVWRDPLSLPAPVGKELANEISLHLGVHMTVTDQDQGRVILEEEPPLTLVTGTATACAVNREEKGEDKPDNGDAVLTRSLSGGRQLLALSDGMGHGADAQEESRKTLDLLSLCLEAGYTRSQAMTAVNGAMLSAAGGEKFATVDLCLVDLWTGEAVMNKLGACCSFLLQGQKAKTIEGAALPLGIIEHVMPMEHTFKLSEGDVVLLLSDGITDAFPEEQDIMNLLARCRELLPQRIADTVLREALMRQDGLPNDDMTVLCARVTARNKRW